MVQALYPKTKEEIERGIAKGRWGEKLPGVYVLAEELGVSHLTVTRAIRLLEEEGKVMVRGRSGTFVTSRNVLRQRYNTISVVGKMSLNQAYAFDESEFASLYGCIHGHGLEMFSVEYSNSENPSMGDILASMKVDGHVFTHSMLNENIACALKKSGVPFVSLNRIDDIPGVNWVDYDNEQGIGGVLDYFLARGYRRIAMAGYAYRLDENTERVKKVFMNRLADAGVFDSRLLLLSEKEKSYSSTSERQSRNLEYAERLVAELRNTCGGCLPEALFVPQSPMGMAIAKVIDECGLKMQKDIHVATTGELSDEDISFARFEVLLQYPYAKRSERAMQILAEMIDDPETNVRREMLPIPLKIMV